MVRKNTVEKLKKTWEIAQVDINNGRMGTIANTTQRREYHNNSNNKNNKRRVNIIKYFCKARSRSKRMSPTSDTFREQDNHT